MKEFAQILVVIFLFGIGCKTVENTQKSSNSPQTTVDTLNFVQQKAFDKVFYEASKQKLLNNKEKASTLYAEALTLNPSSHTCMYELSVLNYDQKNYFKALEFAQKAVQKNTEYNPWYFSMVANAYKKLGMLEQSAMVYSDMVTLSPNERSNYLKSANAYFKIRSNEKAIAMLRKMQNKFGIEQASSMQLVTIYSSIGETEKAIAVLEKISNQYPSKISYLGRLADIYIREKQDGQAISILKKIIEIDSTSGNANFILHIMYLDKDDQLSLKYLKRTLVCDDVSLEKKLQALGPLLKGETTSKQKKNDLMELAAILVENYPSKAAVYFFEADMHVMYDDYQSARKSMSQALKKDAFSFAIWKKILYLNERLHDYDQQLLDANSAIALFPNVARLYHTKCKALNELSAYKLAIKTAEEGLQIAIDKTDKTDLMIAKGEAYRNLGEIENAKQLLETILSNDPNNISALNTYSLILISEGSQLNDAEKYIDKALVFQPQSPTLLATKAKFWFAKNNTNQALDLLEKAIQLDSKNAKYLNQKKLIYEYLGDEEKANKMKLKIENLHEE